jgi:hypothetical protein
MIFVDTSYLLVQFNLVDERSGRSVVQWMNR